jgi:hypothetical protein
VKRIVLSVAILLTSTAFANSDCALACLNFPNLYKGLTNTYPCTNGSFQYQPFYQDNTEGNNVTLTFQPTNGGTITNIVNLPGTAITWTHSAGIWYGTPTNFAVHGQYKWTLVASGANCTIQGKAQ